MITSFVNTMCNFSFRGRATKKEFISFIIISILISLLFLTLILSLAFIILEMKINLITGDISIPYRMRSIGAIPFFIMTTMSVFYLIFNIWAAISGALLAIRRLHDINCSGVGYWIWIASIIAFCSVQTSILTGFLFYFIIGSIIALSIKSSFPYSNKYGNVEMEEIIKYQA